jgi:hypothetical protein
MHPSHIFAFSHTKNPDPNSMEKNNKNEARRRRKKRRVKFFNIYTEHENNRSGTLFFVPSSTDKVSVLNFAYSRREAQATPFNPTR